MKRTLMLMALAAVSAPAWCEDWEAAMQPSLYSVTFADYADGEKLSNKGAAGGSWTADPGTIPALAMARTADVGGRGQQAMEYVSLSDIVFGVTNQGSEGAKAFRIATWVTAYEAQPPKLEATDKFAFTIATRADGTLSFVGWSAKDRSWKEIHLASGKIKPESHAWYDLSVWVVTGVGNRIRVQYRLKVGADEYEPLLTDGDEAWLDAGAASDDYDSIIRSVAFCGEGAFDKMAGKELPSPGLSVHFH